MEYPDYWQDVRRFLIGLAIGGVAIGLMTLFNIDWIPN